MTSKSIKLNLADLTTKVFYTKKPDKQFFKELRQHRLYVPGWTFSQYYSNPELEFFSGAIMAVAYLNNIPISVALINLKFYSNSEPKIGFFTRVKFRRNGIAKFLGLLAFEKYQEIGFTSPILAEDGSWTRHWRTAFHICQSLNIPSIPD